MIAEVNQGSGLTPEQARGEQFRAVCEHGASAEGTEILLVLADAATGEGMSIHVWRDQDALDAYQSERNRNTRDAESQGVEVDTSRVYDVLYRS
jgi:hypothetical protein